MKDFTKVAAKDNSPWARLERMMRLGGITIGGADALADFYARHPELPQTGLVVVRC